MPEPVFLPITLRAFALRRTDGRPAERHARTRQRAIARRRRYGSEVLVTDVETATDPAMGFQFAFSRLFAGAPGRHAASTCVEEALYYADDLGHSDPAAMECMRDYAERHSADVSPGFPRRLRLMPKSQWLEERLFRYGYRHRDRCTIVFFNALFDLGALCSYWSPAEGYYRGGYSLGLWGTFDERGRWHDRRYRPRLLVKAIDPRRALIGWGAVGKGDDDGRGVIGNVVDLHQTVFALTDRSHKLETACGAFGIEFKKSDVTYGRVDAPMLDYARDDVCHTALLYRRCLEEIGLHTGVSLKAARLFSPATVGAAYQDAMGLPEPLPAFAGIARTR